MTLTLFDFHAKSGRMALRMSDLRENSWLETRSLEGKLLGKISNDYLPQGFHWSPDGSEIAFGSNDGFLYVYRLGDLKPKSVFTERALQAGFCEWSPDGSQLVFSAYERESTASPNIYCLDLGTDETRQLTDDPKMVDRFPHWSPSGNWISIKRQYLDEPEVPPRVYLLEMQSRNCLPLLESDETDYYHGRFGWSPDSSTLLVTQMQKGINQLKAIRFADKVQTWSYELTSIRGGAFSPSGDRILCICVDELLWFSYPQGKLIERLSLESMSPVKISLTGPQIGFDLERNTVYFLCENSCLYRWNIGGVCETIQEEGQQTKPAFEHEAYTIVSRDGRSIPVQRFIPPHPRKPAILYVHGGPGEAIDPDDPFMLRLLEEGYEFVCAAYRGSTGYGGEHAEANRGEYGRADVWDLIACGLDWTKRSGKDRPLILAGYSYGGFLTFLSLAQKENIWAGGIALWSVMDLHHLGLHRHRALPADPVQRGKAEVERSPIKQAGNIHVPMLIFHGVLDTAATTVEAQSIQNTILRHGGECDLVIYEDDTHSLMRHRDDIHQRVMKFLERFK
jgi:dipeptidyl aminopeptidase/acylaminoacyl peptidase